MIKTSVRPFAILALAVLTLVSSGSLVGCGPEFQAVDNSQDNQKSIQKGADFMAIYKAANGNYDALTPEQKAELLKISDGDEVRARASFIGVKDPAAAQKYMMDNAPAKK